MWTGELVMGMEGLRDWIGDGVDGRQGVMDRAE